MQNYVVKSSHPWRIGRKVRDFLQEWASVDPHWCKFSSHTCADAATQQDPHTYICIYTYIQTNTYIHIHTYTPKYIYTYIHKYMLHNRIHTHIHREFLQQQERAECGTTFTNPYVIDFYWQQYQYTICFATNHILSHVCPIPLNATTFLQ